MTSRILVLLGTLLLIGAARMSLAADDAVKQKLEQAKAVYDMAMEKFRAAVGEYFDRREEVARKDGNKKLVDEVKADRQLFAEKEELPAAAPMALKQKVTSARAALETAYQVAIKEYTRTKRDEEAAAMEKELAAFRSGPVVADTRQRWVFDKGEFKMTGKDSWEEVYPNEKNKTYQYKETGRTKEYIQLDALNGNLNVRWRIYETKADLGLRPDYNYTTRFTGKWVK